jgi:hypothetical protein
VGGRVKPAMVSPGGADGRVARGSGRAELPAAWGRVHALVAAQQEWQPYCGPKGCQCAVHPSFEYYPGSFAQDGKLFVYVPVKKAP